MRSLLPVLGVLLLGVMGLPVGGAAQSTYGAVVGAAADSSGGVLPGAAVTLTEVQTSFTRATATNDSGAFEFQNLTSGLYVVRVELSGFEQFATDPFRVEARQTVRIAATLAVDGLAEQVVVRTIAPIINTETPTVGGAVDNRELQELPFTFRTQNTSPIPAIQKIPEVQRVGSQFSLSGGLPYQTEVSVDGILTTSVRRNGIGAEGLNVFPSIESIGEIKVSSVTNTAEFAQLGDITTVSRPGTNELHGSLFINYNGTDLNANPNYFNKDVAPNQSDNTNFGLSIGGPVVPSRTFFFGAFERLDIGRTQSASTTVPSSAFRQGDFSSVSTPIIDPVTGRRFSGNRIPAARLNPVAARLLDAYIPAPNEEDSIYRYTIDASEVSNQFDIRLDQNFNQRHTLFGRVSWKEVETVSPTTYESLGPRSDVWPNRTFVVSDNYSVKSGLLNELRVGYTSADHGFTTGRRGPDVIDELGLALLSTDPPDVTGTPSIQIAGYTNFGESQEEPLTQDTWQIANNITWLRGRHTVKGGFDIKWFNWTSPLNFTGADDYGVFRFNDNIQGGGAGHPFANFLLGLPTEVDQTASGPNVDGVATHYGFFIQDEWRANASVTVSGGLRYELRPPFEDREENITNFLRDTENGDVVVPSEASVALTAPGFASSIGDAQVLAADAIGYPKSLRFADENNLEPRLGIAWRPGGDNRTVIRAGYGIYHARILGQVFNSLTGIHTSDNVTFRNALDPVTRGYSIVWPNTYAGDPSRGEVVVGAQNFSTANDPRYKDPMTQQWSLTFERELAARQAFRFTYSGFRSTDLTMAPDLNQIEPNTVGFANLSRDVRPYPNWNRVNTRDNGGYHTYHDLVFQLRGDIGRWGLSHTNTYKWAHSIDNIEERGAGQTDFQSEINGRTDNRFEPDYLRGKTTNIPDHRLVSSVIWNIPIGRGRTFASALPVALDVLAGGWTVSTLVQIQSGPHLTAFYSGHCGSGTNCFGNEKADTVPGQDPNNGPKSLDRWFNTEAFSIDAFRDAQGAPIFAGRFGNAEKGRIIGPVAWNVDLAAFKDVRFAERATIRFNVFITNLFNHANWGPPVTDLTSANYGQITSLSSLFPLRTIVIGARVMY
ncbi:MAG: hypothetical protein GEV06_03295 [Luteitalea sp.]|nr:hypothetical protein [Luteitalea sp.]